MMLVFLFSPTVSVITVSLCAIVHIGSLARVEKGRYKNIEKST